MRSRELSFTTLLLLEALKSRQPVGQKTACCRLAAAFLLLNTGVRRNKLAWVLVLRKDPLLLSLLPLVLLLNLLPLLLPLMLSLLPLLRLAADFYGVHRTSVKVGGEYIGNKRRSLLSIRVELRLLCCNWGTYVQATTATPSTTKL